MLNQMMMVFAFLCLCGGAAFLYVGVLRSDTMVLVGAAIMTLGLLSAASVLKTWLRWRRYQRKDV